MPHLVARYQPQSGRASRRAAVPGRRCAGPGEWRERSLGARSAVHD